MIYDELYQGYNFGIGHGQWTNPIITIPIDTESFTNSYYLGWVRYENIPTIWKTSVYYFDSNAGMLSFNDISVRQNVSIGFAGKSASGPSPTFGSNYRYLTDTGYSGYANRWGNTWGQGSDDPSDGYGNRLLNKWMPLSTSYRKLVFTLYCLYSGWNNLPYGDRCKTPEMSIADFISFMNGNTSLTFTFASGLSYTLTGTDFTDGYYLDETNNRKIIIASYEFYTNQFYNPDNDLETQLFSGVFGQSDYFYNDEKTECITTGTVVQKTWLSTEYHEMFGFRYFGNIGSSWTICADKTRGINTSTVVQQGTPFGGLITGDISQTQMNDFTTYGQYIEMENNNYLIYGYETAGTNFKIVHGYTPSEIYKHAALFRWTPNSKQYGYEDGVVYFPKIDLETDEFLCELITGTKEEVEPQLPLWFRRDDPTLSEYDDTKKPEPEPEPPEDSEDNSESGDKVPNQFGRTVGVTSNFVTNYLMTEGQISKLGEVLWTSWADDTVTMDMVNNFYGKFHDATGSWNVSDALQFIVSCRLFPCSLATRVNTTQVTSIPIGTGAFALQCGTSSEPRFFIANEATAILNCGSVLVERKYNDYRDFENTKITAYLPFCGSVELNPQDVVGKWLGCTYAIDLFDGSCKAFIYTLSGDDVGYEGAYYNVAIKQGQCGFLIPLSATQAGQVASRQKVDGYTDGALLFNAGMSVIGAALESTSGGSPDTGIMKAISTIGNYGFQSDILSAQRSGRPGIAAPYLSGGSGFTDFHQPASAYIQIRRSYYQEPIEYEHSAGYPVNAQKYGNLSQFSGFITCSNVDISGFTCHEDERAEIKSLLESGVYL
jgi:hypothetical protein